MTAATTPAAPPLAQPRHAEAQLLDDYWNPALSLREVAARNAISFRDLESWAARPDTIAELDRLSRLETDRSRRLVVAAHAVASSALVRAAAAPSPDAARRAAASLARLTPPPRPDASEPPTAANSRAPSPSTTRALPAPNSYPTPTSNPAPTSNPTPPHIITPGPQPAREAFRPAANLMSRAGAAPPTPAHSLTPTLASNLTPMQAALLESAERHRAEFQSALRAAGNPCHGAQPELPG